MYGNRGPGGSSHPLNWKYLEKIDFLADRLVLRAENSWAEWKKEKLVKGIAEKATYFMVHCLKIGEL